MQSVEQKISTTNPFEEKLVKADKLLDKTPLSPINNLLDIIFKGMALAFTKIYPPLRTNHYVHHLNNKSFKRCFALAIPVFGFIFVALYDHVKNNPYLLFSKEERQAYKKIVDYARAKKFQTDFKDFELEEGFSKNSRFMLYAIKKIPTTITLAHADLKKNESFMLEAVIIDTLFISFADPSLRYHPEFIIKILREFEKITSEEEKNKAYDSLFNKIPNRISLLELTRNKEKMSQIIEKFPRCAFYTNS